MIKLNDKVKPVGYTKDDLGIGTVQEIQLNATTDGKAIAFVYWPNIEHEGAWPIDELAKV